MGCLVIVLVLASCVTVSFCFRLSHDRHAALDRMEDAVTATKSRLERSAVDGELLGTEIDRDLMVNEHRDAPLHEVRRVGRVVTVVAQFTGNRPGLVWGTSEVTGCYRFRSVPPSVSVSRLPDQDCRHLPYPYHAPATVARDVVTEVRTSVARGGLRAVPAADVWSTPGLQLVAMETGKGRFAAYTDLLQFLDAPQCYEFRARGGASTVTARHVPQQQCDSREHSDPWTIISAARRSELEASAGRIEQRIRHDVADGRLTEAELTQALALPRTDGRGRPVPREPVGVLLKKRRSATEAVVTVRIEDWQQSVSNAGCFEFRADLTRRSVTRLRTGIDCLQLPSP
ncbi:hypothetical protein [Streptomyces sp. NPDC005799]|uniref:hypothetical protein n=1 Tax=Streptomyces sp. NPDC005799 TaxID=3154678 RepID=UPI003401EF37